MEHLKYQKKSTVELSISCSYKEKHIDSVVGFFSFIALDNLFLLNNIYICFYLIFQVTLWILQVFVAQSR